jgi:hypothetical protein
MRLSTGKSAAAANKSAASILTDLSAEFPGSAIKTRKQSGISLTYLSIDSVIGRLNDVAGLDWGEEDVDTTITTLHDGKYAVVVTGYIRIGDTRRAGIGADVASDLDKACKTALAEMRKKAGHAYGIGLYLWSEDGRTRAETRMKLDKNRDSEATLKRAVFELAKAKNNGEAPDGAAGVAKILGVPAGDLSDKAKLVAILEAEGVL